MMTNTISLNGFILHKKPYKNSSLIISVLMEDGMLVRGVYRGGQKKNLSLFSPYWLSYIQNFELALFVKAEPVRACMMLQGRALFCGLYLNELIVKLITHQTPIDDLYGTYERTLEQLSQEKTIEPALRLFECFLLGALGYEVVFNQQADGRLIEPKAYYSFVPKEGFHLINDSTSSEFKVFLGEHLLAIARRCFKSPEALLAAKRILRLMLNDVLQGRPIKSRQLLNSSPHSF